MLRMAVSGLAEKEKMLREVQEKQRAMDEKQRALELALQKLYE